MTNKFDQADPLSIESYAKKLKGSSLRKYVNTDSVKEPGGGRGSFGLILEKYYFGIEQNSRPEPDFKEAGLEVKSSPLKKLGSGKLVAKERLVMNMITYGDVVKENFENSSFLYKNHLLLLIFYLYEKGVNVLDYVVQLARMWKFPEEDIKIIKDDWTKIVEKIKAGKAHELSEGDTLYLGACTKSSNSSVRTPQPFSSEPAKPRAFSLKQNYLNGIVQNLLEEAEPIVKNISEYKEALTFEDIVRKRFEPFIGMTSEDISKKLNLGINQSSKNYFATLARRIMGVQKQKVLEFEKAGVEMKVVQIKKSGMPKEDMSFPKFNYMELSKEKWEDIDENGEVVDCEFKQQLQKRFFFVVFECADTCKKEEDRILKKVLFWTMPVKDIEGEVKRVWEETVKKINNGNADELPKKSESSVAHVRPHARDASDTEETPENGMLVKKCFWLNKEYIERQIR